MTASDIIQQARADAFVAWGFVERLRAHDFDIRAIMTLTEMIEEGFGPAMRAIVLEIYAEGVPEARQP